MFVKLEKEVKIRPWMSECEFLLVTPDNLSKCIDECIEANVYALDLETTGLDTRIFEQNKTEVEIVGVCLSGNSKRGWYIPLRHTPNGQPSEHNLPFSVFEPEFRRLMDSDSVAVVHNCKFEGELLTYHGSGEPFGNWDDVKTWEDTQILAYLDDSNRKSLGLKGLSKTELGKEMIELAELFPKGTTELDYSMLDPTDNGVVEYAASDAICTLELYHRFYPGALELTSKVQNQQQSQGLIHKIEKLNVPSVRWMERCRVPIDLEKTAKLMHMARLELVASLKTFYKEVSELLGRDITPVSFFLFCRDMERNDPTLGVDTQDIHAPTMQERFDAWKKEAKTFYKRYQKQEFALLQSLENDPELKALLSRETPSAKEGVELLREYDVLSNAQLGVLMYDMGVPNLKRTETGAIKASKDVLKEVIDKNEDLPFMVYVLQVRQNNQALMNLTSIWRDTDRRDNTLLIQFRPYAAATGRFSAKGDRKKELTGGTSFNLQSMPAGKDPKAAESLLRIRECIAAPEGYKVVAIDYSGQELRVSTNLSGEPLWIEQFFMCSTCKTEFPRDERPPKYCFTCGSDRIGDIHTLTGIQLYGEDATRNAKAWKKKRNIAKGVNFSLLFGGGPGSIERTSGVDRQEASRIVSKFKSSYRRVKAWWQYSEKFCRKHGYVLTAFDRKHALPDIYHTQRFFQQKAVRNSKNSPIQGTGADLTKMAMGIIYQKCKKLGWDRDKVKLIITMHDELVFVIADDVLEEAIQLIVQVMTDNPIIRTRNWKVPLTVDVELGSNWTVKYNLYETEFLVGSRRELQNPENTDEDVARIVRRLVGFYGDAGRLQEALSSFEDIRWPEYLAPHFKSGREDAEPLSEAEKEMLAKAWKMAIRGVSAPSTPPTQKMKTKTKPEPTGFQVYRHELSSLDESTARKVAQALVEAKDPGGHILQLIDPAGNAVKFPNVMKVDPEKFREVLG